MKFYNAYEPMKVYGTANWSRDYGWGAFEELAGMLAHSINAIRSMQRYYGIEIDPEIIFKLREELDMIDEHMDVMEEMLDCGEEPTSENYIECMAPLTFQGTSEDVEVFIED